MSYDMPTAIVIPTYNLRERIGQAVQAALGQSHPDCIVIAVDDGSGDATWQELRGFQGDPRFAALRLSRNLGTGAAKNTGILLSGARAVSFHDSDDRPHPDKLLRQSRALGQTGLPRDPCLNWSAIGLPGHAPLELSAVFTHHELILPDGSRQLIRRDISIIDDVFPNVQMGTTVPGEWLHINSGLFHPRIFAQLGGYADTIEEDREFRNRIVLSGHLVWVIQDALLTKIETAGSLTQSRATDYISPARTAAREAVWREVATWMQTRRVTPKPIDLPPDAVAEVINPGILVPSAALATPATRQSAARWIGAAEMQKA